MGDGELQKKIHEMFHTETLTAKNEVQGVFLTFCDSAKKGLLEEVAAAKRDFPVEFWWAVIGEDEGGETIEERERMPNASLPKNRANAIIDKDEVIDWFLKYFGDAE